MIYKKFDPNLHNENDYRAKCVVADYFIKKYGYEVTDNPDKYGVDLIVFDIPTKSHIGYLECEIKQFWNAEKFQSDTIRIPYRKIKYTILDKPTTFVVLNKNCTHGMWIKGSELLECKTDEIANKYEPFGEKFFIIPTEKCRLFNLVIR